MAIACRSDPEKIDVAPRRTSLAPGSEKLTRRFIMQEWNLSDQESRPSPGEAATKAAKIAPRTARFIYGGYLVLALAAIILSWKLAPSALTATAVLIIVLATLVALLTQALSRRNSAPAAVALWCVLGGCILIAALFICSAFLGVPERGATMIARLLNQGDLAILRTSNPAVELSAISVRFPDAYKAAPDSTGDRFDRISELSKRGLVSLKGATVVLDGPAFYFGILRLDDSKIVTAGRNVTIEAVRIEAVGNASIDSYFPAPATGAGQSGGQVALIVHDRIRGQLAVDLSGTVGAMGAQGRDGVPGAGGGPGENSAQGLFDCKHGGGTGGAGQPGGKGEDGAPGSSGGDGGTLLLQAPDADQAARSIAFSAKGGEGGPGGRPGRGGDGGPGGPGGHGGGYCGGGQAGPPGARGPDGRGGIQGKPGNEGRVVKLGFDGGSMK